MIPISKIFSVTYGNKLDFNKMRPYSQSDGNGINFVSRTAENNGVAAIVQQILTVEPYEVGLITVALGGSILSSFVQPRRFYTAQNVAVLQPRMQMTLEEKLYYCLCIQANRFRYGTFGREANRTLKQLTIPEVIPSWIHSMNGGSIEKMQESNNPFSTVQLSGLVNWLPFRYEELFEIKKGKRVTNDNLIGGFTPLVRPIDTNNGVTAYTDLEPNAPGNLITVNYNGNGVAEAYYQPTPFFAVDDVNILYPKFALTPAIAMFIITLIRKEKYRFNYGRKWHLGRMKESVLKLPATADGQPDWAYMETYIKSLPFSAELEA